jgi:flagellar FliL protein
MATMTDATKAGGDADASGEKKKGKLGKKKLILILVVVLLLGGGGGGAYYWFFVKDAPPPAPEAGKVVPLEAITINLTGGHFLKIRIALQATADVEEPPDGSKALDLTIAQFSNKSVAELSSNKARAEAKKELKEKIEKAYEDEVMDVYLTEFVMQ